MRYFGKMRGAGKSPPAVDASETLWSWVGAFLGMGLVGWLHHVALAGTDVVLLIAPFGASAVLVFGAIKSPLAQPRNLVGGHVISALAGVAAWQTLGGLPWLAAAAGVATAIALMHATRTLHPPGGATALFAVAGGERIHALGFWYVLVPVAAGALILLLVALLVNNIPERRRYPEYWA